MDLVSEPTTARAGMGIRGASRAFVLLETARLRAETLLGEFGFSQQLWAIKGEIGMAGFDTCSHFDPGHRRACTTMARQTLADEAGASDPERTISAVLATMFSETIAASDALARELAGGEAADVHRDRLHQVHTHVMAACELLDERLTLLEYGGVGSGVERR